MNLEGKMPSDIDRLARLATSSKKTEEQDLMREEGMKSMGDDLEEDLLMRRSTSAGVMGEKESK